MAKARLTSKGRVTIPVEIRKRNKITKRTVLVFYEKDDEIKMKILYIKENKEKSG